jgi:hypothetical protein
VPLLLLVGPLMPESRPLLLHVSDVSLGRLGPSSSLSVDHGHVPLPSGRSFNF